MKHILSFDLEEWYHGELIARHTPSEARIPQVEQGLLSVLSLLDECDTRATFFVVGEVLRDNPGLVEKIAAAGHEIACHGMDHTNLWHLDAQSFARDLHSFQRLLSDVLPGYVPLGFRAPMFSLDRRTAWALRVLKDAGYRYDSSVFPAQTGYYGVGYAPLAPYSASLADPGIVDGDGGLLEVPLTVLPLWKLRVPIAGGTYMRLLPYAVWERLLHSVGRRRPLVLYAHPWEFNAATPRRPLPLLERFALYYNIPRNLTKLRRLLKRFEFGPIRDVLGL
jgi:polysaccharide deacetylase family protein (PEP-CTERM system associated)